MKKIYFLLAPIVVIMILNSFKKTESIHVGFIGDTMLGRMVDVTIHKTSYAYPWGNILPTLQANDRIIANLETTLTNATKAVPKVFNFKASPDVVETLKIGNIGIVNLANNHSLDFDIDGLEETIETLKSANIMHVGAGNNLSEAKIPVIYTIKNTTFGVIGLTDNEPTWAAQEHKPGIWYVDTTQPNTDLFMSISELKKNVDICIVSIHWGPNMRQYPSDEFITFAHRLIDAGVDILHGHSAHIVQGIEIYNNKIIMYDTGDFVDDYVVDPILRNDLSFLFTVEIVDKQIRRLILTPVKIENRQVNHANNNDAQTVIELLKKRSEPFSTQSKTVNNVLIIDIINH